MDTTSWVPEEWVKEFARKMGERRFRLLLAGACRYLFYHPRGFMRKEAEDGLRAFEHFVDTGKNKSTVRNAHRRFRGAWIDTRRPWRNAPDYTALEKTLSIENEMEAIADIVHAIAKRHGISRNQAERELAALASDLNQPEECTDLEATWRTPEIVDLAKAMYSSRDFRQMFQLADLLQESGCVDDSILNHCRDPQRVHIRGCWVVDAILDGSWSVDPKC